MIPGRSLDQATTIYLQQHLRGRMEGMRSDRMSWWVHWAQLAEMYLPRRYKWFITPNNYNKGSQLNAQIIDETGIICARVLANGMMSGLTSPARPWFELGLHDLELVQYGPVKSYLAEVERRMMRVFAESNFYTSLGTLYHDNAVFGSASMIQYEDPEQVCRWYNPCLGEFFFGASSRLDVDSLYREFTMTIQQEVEMFGIENVSDSNRNSFMQGGANRTREIVICHGIEPNDQLWQDATAPLRFVVPKHFKYREVYWEQAQGPQSIICCSGYNEKPFVGARWDIVSNDAYGRSPGMDGMPAVRQLQIEQRRKAEAIDKMVRPPMVASVNMKNEPNSILPAAINYVSDINGSGFKPAFQIDPRLAELSEDLKEVQSRIQQVFFVDLFMMISNLDTVRTATEIDARREEKLVQLGPVIERFENEVLDPIIDRTFAIMSRRGLLPEPPPEIEGQALDVQYVSMLAEAQKGSQTTGIERLLALTGNLSGVDPTVMDIIDIDQTVMLYADSLRVPPQAIRDPGAVMGIRQARAQKEEQAQMAEVTMAGVQGAKTLSETDVGGGQNALSAMINGTPQ